VLSQITRLTDGQTDKQIDRRTDRQLSRSLSALAFHAAR